MAKQTDLFGGLVSPLSKRRCIRESDESDDKTQKFKKPWKEATPWAKVANASNSLSEALPTTWLKLVEEGICACFVKNTIRISQLLVVKIFGLLSYVHCSGCNQYIGMPTAICIKMQFDKNLIDNVLRVMQKWASIRKGQDFTGKPQPSSSIAT